MEVVTSFILEHYNIITIAWIILCVIIGYIRGFAKQIFPLVCIILSGVFIFGVFIRIETIPFLATDEGRFLSFVLFGIVLFVISKISGLINKVPIIGKLNRFLGAVLGLISGALVAFVYHIIFIK